MVGYNEICPVQFLNGSLPSDIYAQLGLGSHGGRFSVDYGALAAAAQQDIDQMNGSWFGPDSVPYCALMVERTIVHLENAAMQYGLKAAMWELRVGNLDTRLDKGENRDSIPLPGRDFMLSQMDRYATLADKYAQRAEALQKRVLPLIAQLPESLEALTQQ